VDKILCEVKTFELTKKPLMFCGRIISRVSDAPEYSDFECHWVDRGEIGVALRIIHRERKQVAYVNHIGYEVKELTDELTQQPKRRGRPPKVKLPSED